MAAPISHGLGPKILNFFQKRGQKFRLCSMPKQHTFLFDTGDGQLKVFTFTDEQFELADRTPADFERALYICGWRWVVKLPPTAERGWWILYERNRAAPSSRQAPKVSQRASVFVSTGKETYNRYHFTTNQLIASGGVQGVQQWLRDNGYVLKWELLDPNPEKWTAIYGPTSAASTSHHGQKLNKGASIFISTKDGGHSRLDFTVKQLVDAGGVEGLRGWYRDHGYILKWESIYNPKWAAIFEQPDNSSE